MHAKSRLLFVLLNLLLIPWHQTLADDAATMHDLAYSITSATLKWSPSSDPCTWSHVQCFGGRVTAIQIGNMGLSGSLPASLNSLTELTRLEVMGNRFNGSLPVISSLSKLQYLFLHNNSFTSIPQNFFNGLNSLVYITIGNNPLNWSLGEDLKSASNLVNFAASDCGIQGQIPGFFGTSFPSLELLELSFNNLTGGIPESFAESTMKVLLLNSQKASKLTGGINVIANMTSLKQLWLHSNLFSGPLPDFSGLINLGDLNLRDNQITGPVPDSLAKLSSLKNVVLTNNLLQGPVPVFSPSVKLDLDVKSERFCRSDKGDCDAKVNILLSIAESFGYPKIFADNWRGNNVCSRWLGITCDSAGNIVIINFSRFALNGIISPSFGSLNSLQKLVLSNNSLTGTIPEAIANLKNLRELDVSFNSLHGKIPSFGENVNVITTGNPDIGKDETENSKGTKRSSSYIALIVVFSLGAILVLLALVFYYCAKFRIRENTVAGNWLNRVRRSYNCIPKAKKDNISLSSVIPNAVFLGDNTTKCSPKRNTDGLSFCEPTNLVIPIEILRHVTNNFSEDNILGRGGFGTVYKGELHDGTKMAVKRMENGVIGSDGLSEFKSEISVLTRVRHRNLVALLGYCLDANEKILVYEYMPQGTLTEHLFEWKKEGLEPLSWKRRLCVGLDVARGVEYLHRLAQQSFIHRDLKPSNILLGDDMRAKVSDFGLVKRAPDGQYSVETRLAGTFGYLAPEYAGM
jgi:kinase